VAASRGRATDWILRLLLGVLVVGTIVVGGKSLLDDVISTASHSYAPYSLVGTQLNATDSAEIVSVSCSSSLSCVAAGTGSSNESGAFLVEERDGAWGGATPINVSLPGAVGESAQSAVASCWNPGDCTVILSVTVEPDAAIYESTQVEAFSISERSGNWGSSRAILHTANHPDFTALDCWGLGNCAIGWDGQSSAYVANEAGGVWQGPVPIAKHAGTLSALACTRQGQCLAGAWESALNSRQPEQLAFAIGLNHGFWSVPYRIAARFLEGQNVEPSSAACAGFYCQLVGTLVPSEKIKGAVKARSFSLGDLNGKIESPVEIGGEEQGIGVEMFGLSCWSPGDCEAVGQGSISDRDQVGIGVTQHHGEWSRVNYLPATPNLLGSSINQVECTRTGLCTGVISTAASGMWSVVGMRSLDLNRPLYSRQAVSFTPLALSCGGGSTCVEGGFLSLTANSEAQNDQAALTASTSGLFHTI
jgi:hypothetical protein